MTQLRDLFIEQSSFISLHVQLHNQLRHLILSGRWGHGTRIPSENQLSKHLGISRSTVRLALQRAEVEGLIERTRGRGTFVTYQTPAARRLIAFIATDLNTDYQLLILKGAENETRAHGYRMIFTSAGSHGEELDILNALQADHVAGVLLWPRPPIWRDNQQEDYAQLTLPIVLVDRPVPGLDFPYVTSDNYNGAAQLMQHLLDLGHKDIVFLCHHQMQLLPVAERFRAYQDALVAANLTPQAAWLIGDPDDEIGSQHIVQAYEDDQMPMIGEIRSFITQHQPSAIFAVNDHVAALALRALRLMGLRIPEDISVAGFDDADMAVYMDVALTTVAQDALEIGRCGAQVLIELIEDQKHVNNQQAIPTQLRIRESTAVPVTLSSTERG